MRQQARTNDDPVYWRICVVQPQHAQWVWLLPILQYIVTHSVSLFQWIDQMSPHMALREYDEPRFFHLAATALRQQQISMFPHISTGVWGTLVISTNIRAVRLWVKTAMILQWRCLRVPDCTHIKSMFINFIKISLCYISPMQVIKLNETWLHKRDLDATSASSEPGGK